MSRVTHDTPVCMCVCVCMCMCMCVCMYMFVCMCVLLGAHMLYAVCCPGTGEPGNSINWGTGERVPTAVCELLSLLSLLSVYDCAEPIINIVVVQEGK
jgi:hypothetical protein